MAETRPAPTWLRQHGLDAFRGLAVLVMILDHVILVSNGPDVVRSTVGRLAMPAFFVLAGHLARAPHWRHLLVAIVGVVLPHFVPWIDSPNVLVWWAAGVVLLWGFRRAEMPAWGLVVFALTLAANGWLFAPQDSYEGVALIALMAVGSAVPRSAFAWCDRLPHWLGIIGRHPLAWYVGHLLVVQAVLLYSTGKATP